MEAQAIVRTFTWKGTEIPDPNPNASPSEVQAILSHQYPEIANAAIDGPTMSGASEKYTFVASVGTKG